MARQRPPSTDPVPIVEEFDFYEGADGSVILGPRGGLREQVKRLIRQDASQRGQRGARKRHEPAQAFKELIRRAIMRAQDHPEPGRGSGPLANRKGLSGRVGREILNSTRLLASQPRPLGIEVQWGVIRGREGFGYRMADDPRQVRRITWTKFCKYVSDLNHPPKK